LIERFRDWKARGGNRNARSSSSSSDDDENDKNGTIGGGWVFPTVRNPSAASSNHKRTSSDGVANTANANNVKTNIIQPPALSASHVNLTTHNNENTKMNDFYVTKNVCIFNQFKINRDFVFILAERLLTLTLKYKLSFIKLFFHIFLCKL
jgi:hypothetical protein